MAKWDDWLFVVDKDYHGWAKNILTESTKDQADAYRAAGYDVLTASEFDALHAAWEESISGDWKEITEEQYEDALNILPPLKWYDGGFFCSEAFSGTLHSFYQRWDKKYYTSLQSIYKDRNAIIKSLQRFIDESRKK